MTRFSILIAAGLLASGLCLAQNPDGPAYVQSEGSPPVGWQVTLGYSGSNLTSICYARSTLTTGLRARTQVAISAVSKANPAVVTSTAHGFSVGSQPRITISGATGTGWTAINASWIATVIDVDTFSIPINSTGFGTLAGTVVFTTTAPRSSVPEWAVQILNYGAGSTLLWKGWISGSSSLQAKCSDAGSATVVVQ